MGKEINLEELFNNNFNCYTEFDSTPNIAEEPAITKDKFKEICLEFGKQLLELAAENVTCSEEVQYDENDNEFLICKIDKQSILNTINQIK